MHAKLLQSYPTLWDTMDCMPPGSSVHGDSLGKNIGVGCHALIQGNLPNPGIEPTQYPLDLFILLEIAKVHSFYGWIVSHYICISHLLYAFAHWQTMLLPAPCLCGSYFFNLEHSSHPSSQANYVWLIFNTLLKHYLFQETSCELPDGTRTIPLYCFL